MKLSLLADAFRVWNILILRVHEQAAPETQHIYQHSHLLPTLLLSQHKDSSRTSSSFLHVSLSTSESCLAGPHQSNTTEHRREQLQQHLGSNSLPTGCLT